MELLIDTQPKLRITLWLPADIQQNFDADCSLTAPPTGDKAADKLREVLFRQVMLTFNHYEDGRTLRLLRGQSQDLRAVVCEIDLSELVQPTPETQALLDQIQKHFEDATRGTHLAKKKQRTTRPVSPKERDVMRNVVHNFKNLLETDGPLPVLYRSVITDTRAGRTLCRKIGRTPAWWTSLFVRFGGQSDDVTTRSGYAIFVRQCLAACQNLHFRGKFDGQLRDVTLCRHQSGNNLYYYLRINADKPT